MFEKAKKNINFISVVNLISILAGILAGPHEILWQSNANAAIVEDDVCTWDRKIDDKIIRIVFLDGDLEVQGTVKKIAQKWLSHANVTFEFIEYYSDDFAESADVRISLLTDSSSSFVGSCDSANGFRATMHLSQERIKVSNRYAHWSVLHEFGHVLGMTHEHQHPDANIQWDIDGIKVWRPNLSDEDIQKEFINVADLSHRMNGYDRFSIMHYPVEKGMAENGYTTGQNCQISQSDSELMGRVYPGATAIDIVPAPLCCTQGDVFEGGPIVLEFLSCAIGATGTWAVLGGTTTATILVVGGSAWLIRKMLRRHLIPHSWTEKVQDDTQDDTQDNTDDVLPDSVV